MQQCIGLAAGQATSPRETHDIIRTVRNMQYILAWRTSLRLCSLAARNKIFLIEEWGLKRSKVMSRSSLAFSYRIDS
jgi:hypothetical protein